MNYLGNAGIYLSETLFGLALFIASLRFWMQWVRADFRNPIGKFIITVTNPIVIPLRKVIPSIGKIDTSTVVVVFIIALIKVIALFLLSNASTTIIHFLLYVIGDVIQHSIYILFAAIFINIIVSWVNPYSNHPAVRIAGSISNPIMTPARKLIPPIGGLDLSPILVFIFLQLSLYLVVAPLKGGF